MSARTHLRPSESLLATFIAACRASWAAAPVIVAVSIVWALSALPVTAAIAVTLPVPWVLLTLPLLLVTTGVFRVFASIAAGRVRRHPLAGIDPGLALIAWSLALVIGALSRLGDLGVLGASALGAVGVLTLPLAFAYGAVRDRRGIAAARGGLLIATLRPDLSLTVAAMAVLAAFAMIVSAGALVLCVPAIVAVFTCSAVTTELDRLGAGPRGDDH